MKYLISVLLITGLSFSQMANGSNSLFKPIVKVINKSASVSYLHKDFNSDGRKETLKGESIIYLGENEYWVKNTTLTSEDGNVFTFNNKLKKNNTLVIRQVTAEYGYILVFYPNENGAEVFIAGENGNKESDPITIDINTRF